MEQVAVRTAGSSPPVSGPLAQEPPAPGDGPILREVEAPELSELTDPTTLWAVVRDAFAELAGDLLVRLPFFVLALVVLLVLLVVVRLVVSGVNRGMRRGDVDFTVRRLVTNLLRITLLLIVALLALSIAGVEVGAMLATLGLIGLGVALALQNVLEQLISGVLILVRKPYSRGDLIETNGVEGFVEDIDLRVTTIRTFDGTLTLVPNADIYTNPLTNLSRRGTRRGTVVVGVDYRDDHERAREVLLDATSALEEVLEEPPPAVLLVALADSAVEFEVRFWTSTAPGVLVRVTDQVLSACKSALDREGITIPWPIRTLAADRHPLQVRAEPTAMPEPDSTQKGPNSLA